MHGQEMLGCDVPIAEEVMEGAAKEE